MTVTVIHAADIHLGSQLRGLEKHEGLPVDDLRNAPLSTFKKIADLCVERDADLLIIAGDLFDGDAPISVLRQATAVIKSITDKGTKVVLIRGNHDATAKMQNRMSLPEGAYELSTKKAETKLFDELNIAVHGRGFDKAKVTDNIVATYPKRHDTYFNLGVLHTSLEGNASHPSYAPCSLNDLIALNYDYWALGHIHKHDVLSKAPWIIYSGSPQARHISELGDHGVYVFEVNDKTISKTPEHIELSSAKWHHLIVTVDTEDSQQDIVNKVINQASELMSDSTTEFIHIARLELKGRCKVHAKINHSQELFRNDLISDTAAALGDKFFFEKIIISTQPPLDSPEVLKQRLDVVGDLARYLEQTTQLESYGDSLPLHQLQKSTGTLSIPSEVFNVSKKDVETAGDELTLRLLEAAHSYIESAE